MSDDKIFISRRKHEELLRDKQRLQEEIERLRKENERITEEKKELENYKEENNDLKKEKKDLEKKVDDLEEQLARLKGSAPLLAASDKTAEAGGIPSSKTFYRRNRQEGEKRPTGGQPGHPGHGRKRPVPNRPSITVTVETCPDCGNHLPGKNLKKKKSTVTMQKRTITDIPLPEHEVYEVIYELCWCNKCKKMVRGKVPWLPDNQEFGPLVACWIAFERMLGLSVTKVQSNLLETYGIQMSEAVVLKLEKWVADSLKGDYEKIREEILKAIALGGDETKFRINGMNGWMWVFTCVMATYYKIAPTRGHTVPEEVLKGYKGGLTRDAWKPYDVLKGVKHQLDLLHVNRWLERAEIKHRIEPRSLLTSKPAKLEGPGRPPEELIDYADGIRAILKEGVVFSEGEPPPTRDDRKMAHKRFKKTMKTFLDRNWKDKDAIRITKELLKRLNMLFTFVRNPEISWNNNAAERDIRPGVLHRKVSGGRRTWAGAGVLEVLLSITQTAKKRGMRFLEWAQKALAVSPEALRAAQT